LECWWLLCWAEAETCHAVAEARHAVRAGSVGAGSRSWPRGVVSAEGAALGLKPVVCLRQGSAWAEPGCACPAAASALGLPF
jgi:hypothetical protein